MRANEPEKEGGWRGKHGCCRLLISHWAVMVGIALDVVAPHEVPY